MWGYDSSLGTEKHRAFLVQTCRHRDHAVFFRTDRCWNQTSFIWTLYSVATALSWKLIGTEAKLTSKWLRGTKAMPFLLGLMCKVATLLLLGLIGKVVMPPSQEVKAQSPCLFYWDRQAQWPCLLYLNSQIHRHRSHAQFTGIIKHRCASFSLGQTWIHHLNSQMQNPW